MSNAYEIRAGLVKNAMDFYSDIGRDQARAYENACSTIWSLPITLASNYTKEDLAKLIADIPKPYVPTAEDVLKIAKVWYDFVDTTKSKGAN